MIVLSVDPSLLYLLGDPKNPVVVWKQLSDQFQKKTWANKLELHKKLYSLRLQAGESVQTHIKKMTELFEACYWMPDSRMSSGLTTAVVRNHCPTKEVSEMTPNEAWYSEKPKVEHLRGVQAI